MCSLCEVYHDLECKRGRDTYPIISIPDFRDIDEQTTFLHWCDVDVQPFTPQLQHRIYTHFITSPIAYFLLGSEYLHIL